MQRVASRECLPAIQEAFRLIPKPIHCLLRCDFLLGVDPIRAGLHNYTDTSDGRSNRDTAHVFYGAYHALGDKRTTVVLPIEEDAETIVHELGHVLDEAMGFSWEIAPVCDYAETDRYEAFACAFAAFLIPHTANAYRSLSAEEWLFFDSVCRGNQP